MVEALGMFGGLGSRVERFEGIGSNGQAPTASTTDSLYTDDQSLSIVVSTPTPI